MSHTVGVFNSLNNCQTFPKGSCHFNILIRAVLCSCQQEFLDGSDSFILAILIGVSGISSWF